MLFATPALPPVTERRLAELDALHVQIDQAAAALEPAQRAALHATARAATIAASAAIEGFHVVLEDAIALVTGDRSADPADPSQLAVAGCALAMEHVDTLAADPSFRWLDRVLLDLHYDACSFQRDQEPGRWRTAGVGVVDGRGRMLYLAPAAERVPGLMLEIVEWLASGDLDAPVVVRAAMAHLHVVSVHPFRDGNGRVSRVVQALVLASNGRLAPELASIEECFWERRPAYYKQLQRVHGSAFDPTRDAGDWVTFCIDCHLAQARRRLTQADGWAKGHH